MKNPPAISLPQGVRDILPEDALGIGVVETKILSIFSRYGFKRVITPLLEYVDVLSLGMGDNLKDRVLKFIDPSTGRVVAIRPDITPQIARIAATRMRDYPLPLKLCYNASVLRYHDNRDGRRSEVLQVGAEFIAKESSPEADAEMIIIAAEALCELGLKDFKIDIGDVGFLRAVFDGLNLSEPEKKLVKEAIGIKDSSGLDQIINSLGGKISKADRELLLNLTTFYGEDEVIKKASAFVGKSGSSAASRSLENLKCVFSIVANKGFKDFVTIDLGEVRGFDYYPGIIFEGFARGVGKSILSGGRYDNLLGKYGFDMAATGFAFDVENIITALGEKPRRV
jgi:ATP phosphoribosyltransferase regulatory subunit